MARVQKPADEKRDARINLAFTPELKKQLEDIASVDEISHWSKKSARDTSKAALMI